MNERRLSTNDYGKRSIPEGAIEHFLTGGTPLQFIDTLVERAKANGMFNNDPDGLEEAAAGLRREWAE